MIDREEQYTPLSVFVALQQAAREEGDPDERVDVLWAVEKLPQAERHFIRLLAMGYTASEALHAAGDGVDKNTTRLRKKILVKLANILNGK